MKTKPQYLFVCVENACRSQMAQGLFNSMTKNAVAISAGTKPVGIINPMAIEVMKERGIDISGQGSTILSPELTRQSTKVITMGCLDQCPYTPSDKTITWNIPDPKGKGKDSFFEVRDVIERHVEQLLRDEDLFSSV